MIALCELLSEVCQSIMRTLILAKITTLLVSFYTHVVVKAFFHTSEKTNETPAFVCYSCVPTELCISVSPAHWLDENTNLPKALNPHNVSNALPNLRFNTPCNKLQDFRSDSNESLFSFLNGQIVC